MSSSRCNAVHHAGVPASLCLALAGLEKLQEPVEEEEAFVVNDDTLLNRDNVAVNWETKTEISPTSMTTAQMKAELESKGLPTDGVKRELTRRIQVRPPGPLNAVSAVPSVGVLGSSLLHWHQSWCTWF